MAYSVKTSAGTQTGLASTTACVLWHASVANRIASLTRSGWDYATVSGSTFTFFQVTTSPGYVDPSTRTWVYPPPTVTQVGTVSLTTESLARAIAGAQVLIDDGTGKWHLGTVTSDGTSQSASGQTFPTTAPAAVPLADNGQQAPPVGAVATLTGTASDGTLWFSVAANFPTTPGGTWICSPQTTVGALAVGTTAFVQISGQWQVVTL